MTDQHSTTATPAAEVQRAYTQDGTLVLMDIEATDFNDCLNQVLVHLDAEVELSEDERIEIKDIFVQHADLGPDVITDGVAIVTEQYASKGATIQVLARLSPAMNMRDRDGHSTEFLWVLLSDSSTHPHMDVAAEFAHLMHNPAFRVSVTAAETPEALEAAYTRGVADEAHLADHHIPPELQRTGRFAGGLIADIKRRAPFYVSDFTDGINVKSLASIFFLYFACLAPAIAFGGLVSVLTGGAIGAVEMIVATAICGVVYALTSGQPLTILGSTGPVIIFIGILYQLCGYFAVPFLPTLAWVGFWTAGFLLVLAFTDSCSWIRFFTRFTDDTFAALISLIFIVEALKDVGAGFAEDGVSSAAALFQLLLAIGTFYIAMNLSRFRRSRFLRRPVREFLADFGPAIAIFMMTAVAYSLPEVNIETLAVPESVTPTMERGWLVNPLEAPTWVWAASALPAVLVSILLFLDQNITVRLVNNPEFKLKKGAGYHLDLAIVAVLVAVCSLFGLPWMVAATVRSLNHVRSLAILDSERGGDEIKGVVENRVTGIAVHALVGLSLLFLGVLALVPMSVLFGLFLFMGVASMTGNQLFERMQLWFVDPKLFPPTYYLRAVPTKVVHSFTAVQAACLVVLWVVKASVAGIIFPLLIALLVPVRMLLERFFKSEHLALLDAEELPHEEENNEID